MKTVHASTLRRREAREDASATAWRERSGRLYLEFQRQALAMVRRAFRGAFSEQELEDIYSGAWLGTLRALDGRHSAMSDDEVRKYVLTAVANQAAKELRRRKRKPTAPLELIESVRDDAETPDERAAERERSRVTRDLLVSLPPRRRAVILLRYGWGLDPAQVCELVDGLSPRAYRKEITRGVDELTDRMRRFELGSWCEDREPILKSMVAGVASEDEERQGRAHLSHCRDCSEFVASLRTSLHDLGGALVVAGGAGPFDGEVLTGGSPLLERARDMAGEVAGRGELQATSELAARTITSGGVKGGGAASAGILAKLAGIGAAGKATVACLAGGAAATACIAAGLGPTGNLFPTSAKQRDEPAVERAAARSEPLPGSQTLPSQVGNEHAPAPSDAEAEPVTEPASAPPAESAPEPVEEVVAPTAPPVEQEFGVAAAAAPAGAAADSSSGDGGGGSGPSAVQQEFGP